MYTIPKYTLSDLDALNDNARAADEKLEQALKELTEQFGLIEPALSALSHIIWLSQGDDDYLERLHNIVEVLDNKAISDAMSQYTERLTAANKANARARSAVYLYIKQREPDFPARPRSSIFAQPNTPTESDDVK